MAADSAVSLEQFKSRSWYKLLRIPIELLLKELKCTAEGLTSEEGANRLRIFGPNKLEEKKKSKILKFLGYMWNPLSCVMIFAAIIAIGMNGGGKTPDWEVFMGIVMLLVINSTISFIEENNAPNAAATLMAGFSPKTKVLRDGRWSEQEAAILVPGDIISIKSGDVVPADARILKGNQLKFDRSALVGGSFLTTRNLGDGVLSGSICIQGEMEAVVLLTGINTFFGEIAHLADSTNQVGHLEKVFTAIRHFCTCSVMIAIIIEIIVVCQIQNRNYKDGINNLLVLMIGGIPIAMPTVLSVTMAIGSRRLFKQGAITKRMTAIVEMAGMDTLCCDKTGTLTLNKLSVDRNLIEVFAKGVDKEHVILIAARASKTENQDAIDTAVVGMLADPKEARAGISEVHFLPFNHVDKRTALTYIDSNGNWHRASKGAPVQILNLCNCKEDVRKKVRTVVDKFAERGLRSLAVATQEVPERTKESAGTPWQFVGLLPLFDPPRHDSAETIRRALTLGINVKMITGDSLVIAKETGRRLGMGTNMYPTCARLNTDVDVPVVYIPFIKLVEKADGFSTASAAETIRRVLNLGVNLKMITGGLLRIAKETTGRQLGVGTSMYPTCARLYEGIGAPGVYIPSIDLIEKADGFSAVFPDQKYEIVRLLQESKHICGMTGDGMNDAPALKKADIGIAVAGASDAARNASDIILTEPGLSVIISAVMTSRAIFQRMKNYTIYSVSITIRTILGLLLISVIWKFDFSPFLVLIIAILNDGTIMTISRDRVKPSPMPESWNLREIFVTAAVLGSYLASITVIFFWAMIDTDFFSDKFGVRSLRKEPHEMMAALYLQVSIVSQALIFVTRSQSWSCVELPGLLLASAFIAAELVATLIAVYANWGFARIKGVGWGWAGVIWLYSLVSYLPLDLIKFSVRNALIGKAPDGAKGKTAFTSKNDHGKEDREGQCPLAHRTLRGLQLLETTNLFSDKSSYLVQAENAEQAKTLHELHTREGAVESVVELKGLDNDTIQQHHTV